MIINNRQYAEAVLAAHGRPIQQSQLLQAAIAGVEPSFWFLAGEISDDAPIDVRRRAAHDLTAADVIRHRLASAARGDPMLLRTAESLELTCLAERMSMAFDSYCTDVRAAYPGAPPELIVSEAIRQVLPVAVCSLVYNGLAVLARRGLVPVALAERVQSDMKVDRLGPLFIAYKSAPQQPDGRWEFSQSMRTLMMFLVADPSDGSATQALWDTARQRLSRANRDFKNLFG